MSTDSHEAFYSEDAEAKRKLVDDVRDCCLHNGFFQIVGHRVPLKLQERVFQCSKRFFNLPLEDKVKVSKGENLADGRGHVS